MRSSLFAGALLAGLATAAPQDIDFELADSVPNPVYTTTLSSVSYDPTSILASAMPQITSQATNDTDAASTDAPERRAATACAPLPTGAGPIPSPDTASAFLALPAFASAASSAPVPSGYTQAFSNLNASSNAYGYMGYMTLSTYNVTACANKCNKINGCMAFNIFFERGPSVALGSDCTNPSSTTNIKCVWWGGPVSTANALNSGQLQNQFQIAIAGSNGYVNNTIVTPPGYGAPTDLGSAAIDAPYNEYGLDSFLGSAIFNSGPFDIGLCAKACSEKSAYATAHPPTDGSPVQTCQFFNTYILYVNTTAHLQGQYCAMYSESWPSKYATKVGQYRGSDHYLIEYSYSVSNATDPGGVDPNAVMNAAVHQASKDISYSTLQPFCSSYLGYTTTATVTVSLTALAKRSTAAAAGTPAVLTKYPSAILSSACSLQATPATTTTTATPTSVTPSVVSTPAFVSSAKSTTSSSTIVVSTPVISSSASVISSSASVISSSASVISSSAAAISSSASVISSSGSPTTSSTPTPTPSPIDCSNVAAGGLFVLQASYNNLYAASSNTDLLAFTSATASDGQTFFLDANGLLHEATGDNAGFVAKSDIGAYGISAFVYISSINNAQDPQIGLFPIVCTVSSVNCALSCGQQGNTFSGTALNAYWSVTTDSYANTWVLGPSAASINSTRYETVFDTVYAVGVDSPPPSPPPSPLNCSNVAIGESFYLQASYNSQYAQAASSGGLDFTTFTSAAAGGGTRFRLTESGSLVQIESQSVAQAQASANGGGDIVSFASPGDISSSLLITCTLTEYCALECSNQGNAVNGYFGANGQSDDGAWVLGASIAEIETSGLETAFDAVYAVNAPPGMCDTVSAGGLFVLQASYNSQYGIGAQLDSPEIQFAGTISSDGQPLYLDSKGHLVVATGNAAGYMARQIVGAATNNQPEPIYFSSSADISRYGYAPIICTFTQSSCALACSVHSGGTLANPVYNNISAYQNDANAPFGLVKGGYWYLGSTAKQMTSTGELTVFDTVYAVSLNSSLTASPPAPPPVSSVSCGKVATGGQFALQASYNGLYGVYGEKEANTMTFNGAAVTSGQRFSLDANGHLIVATGGNQGYEAQVQPYVGSSPVYFSTPAQIQGSSGQEAPIVCTLDSSTCALDCQVGFLSVNAYGIYTVEAIGEGYYTDVQDMWFLGASGDGIEAYGYVTEFPAIYAVGLS